jgi:hypothetical protein
VDPDGMHAISLINGAKNSHPIDGDSRFRKTIHLDPPDSNSPAVSHSPALPLWRISSRRTEEGVIARRQQNLL